MEPDHDGNVVLFCPPLTEERRASTKQASYTPEDVARSARCASGAMTAPDRPHIARFPRTTSGVQRSTRLDD